MEEPTKLKKGKHQEVKIGKRRIYQVWRATGSKQGDWKDSIVGGANCRLFAT
jgi:hypothetical protein